MKTKMKLIMSLLAVLTVGLMILAGCGSNNPASSGGTGGGGGVPAPTTVLMGGAIQGSPLVLAGIVSSFTGTPNTAMLTGAVDGASTTATFSAITGITTDGVNLYISDYNNNKIRKMNIITGIVSSITGIANAAMVAGALDGPGATATFWLPYAITTDGTNLYVADTANNKIRKINIVTGVVSSLTGAPNMAMAAGAMDGASSTATFNLPQGITTDGTNLYIADLGNNKIRKIDIATGVVSSLTGTPNTAMAAGAIDGASSAAMFNKPQGITTDGVNLYITDNTNHKIRKINIATGIVSSLTGMPNTAMTGTINDGPVATALFFNPVNITTDGTNLYISDYNNRKIRKINLPTGTVYSLTSGVTGVIDGASSTATTSLPMGIVTDGKSLYIGDSTNYKIRIIK